MEYIPDEEKKDKLNNDSKKKEWNLLSGISFLLWIPVIISWIEPPPTLIFLLLILIINSTIIAIIWRERKKYNKKLLLVDGIVIVWNSSLFIRGIIYAINVLSKNPELINDPFFF